MRRDNHNEAITTITPAETIPVLLPFAGKRDGVVYETSNVNPPLTTSYPIAVMSVNAVARVIESPKYFSPDLRKELLADLQLADALEKGDNERAQELVAGEPLSEQIDGAGGRKRLRPENPVAVLARHITDGVGKARFVVWMDERIGKLRPGLVCGNQREAVYALLLQRLGHPGSWSLCKRCGKLFQKRRTWQPYCSSRCRINEAMRRYRNRLKERKVRSKQSRSRQRKRRRTRQ